MAEQKIKTYRDLIVWQKGMDQVVEIYKATDGFPKSEMFGLSRQIRDAAVSVPCNIAEGYGRNSKADYVRFLHIAFGSLCEVQTQLEISKRLGYLKEDIVGQLVCNSQEVERLLWSLIRKLQAE